MVVLSVIIPSVSTRALIFDKEKKMTAPKINTDKIEQVIEELKNNFDYGIKTKQVRGAYLIKARYDADKKELGGAIGIASAMETRGEDWSSEKTFYLNVREAAYLAENAPEAFRNQFNRIASEIKKEAPSFKKGVAAKRAPTISAPAKQPK
jgi:hypothetical protein